MRNRKNLKSRFGAVFWGAHATLLCALLVFQGCASTRLDKADKTDASQSVSAHKDGDQKNASTNSPPVHIITQAELDGIVGWIWSENLAEQMKDSRFDDQTRNRVVKNITIAGLAQFQCMENYYELLQIEASDDGGEIWRVDLCGEKKMFISSSGKVLKVADVTVSSLNKNQILPSSTD
ncbi:MULTISPECIES: hypothetical protein [unclassified Duganella]|uniref:hypothetical protein n=1 Tax=unclassified Duganella TaxID=2636909 RepID=UPI001028BA30|nr:MULTISPECIES: hypothetical protein [unclassified Duganella]